MGIMDSVKGKLGFRKRDEEYDYDEDYMGYDEYEDDYDDDYAEMEPATTRSGRVTPREGGSSLSGSFRRESRVSDPTPLVSNADVRSYSHDGGYKPPAAAACRREYESISQNYDVRQRDGIGRSSHSEDSLEAARKELASLTGGAGGGAAASPSSYGVNAASGAATRRILTVCPSSYADAAKVAEAFRNGSSVAISLDKVDAALAKRILDFSFGVVSVSKGGVQKIGDRSFFLSQGGSPLTEAERQQLRDSGIA